MRFDSKLFWAVGDFFSELISCFMDSLVSGGGQKKGNIKVD